MNNKTIQQSKRQTWSDYMALCRDNSSSQSSDFALFSYAWYILNHGLAN